MFSCKFLHIKELWIHNLARSVKVSFQKLTGCKKINSKLCVLEKNRNSKDAVLKELKASTSGFWKQFLFQNLTRCKFLNSMSDTLYIFVIEKKIFFQVLA